MNDFNEVKLFGSTSLADVFKQIHKNNKDINKQIEDITINLSKLCKDNVGTSMAVIPLIKDLLDVEVKNNDQLVKMAGIAQRTTNSNKNENNDLINYEEIKILLQEHEEVTESATKLLKESNPTKLIL